ncbi:MAG: ABC transporter permease [Pirellulales bacterium]|nr:ABC transporter permease [Pirellulales bacterium]
MLGPIFGAEMTTGARRLRFFLTRATYGLLLFLILWTNYSFLGLDRQGYNTSSLSINQVAQFSGQFFFFFTFLQLWALMLVSPAALGSLIARERERRTIEYLFATDLTNREIVLGKFAAGWCYVASLLITGLPVLALVMMMGGIAPAELLAVFSVTISTSVFVAALAILVSVRTRRARDGITQTYLLMLFVFVGPFLVSMLLLEPLRSSYEGPLPDGAAYVLDWLTAINPILVLGRSAIGSGGSFFSRRHEVVELILGQSVGSVLVLALAVWSVRRAHLHTASVGVARTTGRWRLPSWRPQVGQRAMLWKEVFIERVSGRRGMIARTAIVILTLAALALTGFLVIGGLESRFQRDVMDDQWAAMNVALGTVIACGLLLVVAVRASTSIATERDRDTWISLICSPLSASEILWAKLAGALFAVRWLLLLVAINWFATLVLTPMFALSLPFLAGTLAILAFAVAALGVFFSLWCQNATRALMSTLAVVFTLGGGYYLCCGCVLLPVALSISGKMSEMMFIALLAPLIPFLLGYPGLVGVTGADATSEAAIPMAYMTGNALYLALGCILFAYSYVQFEKLAGRISLNTSNPPGQGTDPVTRLLRGTNPPGA